MEEETQTIEEMREKAEFEKVIIPTVPLETGKIVDPAIIITLEDKKIGVYFNKIKVYRILDKKNLIEGSLDIFLVDTIKELLKGLAEREKAAEELNKQGGQNERGIRKPDRSSRDDRKPGHGGTESSHSIV
jgi:hypothetical protein